MWLKEKGRNEIVRRDEAQKQTQRLIQQEKGQSKRERKTYHINEVLSVVVCPIVSTERKGHCKDKLPIHKGPNDEENLWKGGGIREICLFVWSLGKGRSDEAELKRH